MLFALATPLVLATEFQLAVGSFLGALRVGHLVPGCDFCGDLVKTDST
jgi:hypothetical protein